VNKIQLLYVENVISRKNKTAQQKLSFFMRLDNLSYDKHCEIVWSGEDGVWFSLPASYHSALESNEEYWSAEITLTGTSEKSLPGNIIFALRFFALDQEYWDNNEGLNYSIQADSGIKVVSNQLIQNIGFDGYLSESQRQIPITVSINQSVNAKAVTIHWTIDNWLNTYVSPCQYNRNYWDEVCCSNARNPNQYGSQIWQGFLKIENAFRVQYIISCEVDDEVFWDNNGGKNYSLSHEPLKVLILNLHCYQEDDQDKKFSQIAKAINEQNADVICFQEVAELWNDGNGNWDTNSAKIINDKLLKPYFIYTDWAHLGFDKYREGVAILSRYPFINQSSKYVSDTHSPYSIHSRKVVMTQINVPFIGVINCYSAHLSWWADGFSEQFKNLSQWAEDNQTPEVKATLLCGDFNIIAGSEGYNLVVNDNRYDDQFLAVKSLGVFEKIFKVNDPHWQHYLADDYRIDYIFMNKASELKIIAGNVLFTDEDYGRVSDHCGYLMTFEPK
jgi:maltose 6'-phosphate phosphatase